MPIDLSSYAEALGSALADGTPSVVATAGDSGIPNLGFNGSLFVFDNDHLAYWERTRGQHLENVRIAPGVAVMYFNREKGKYLRASGQAEIHEDGPVRDAIMAKTPEQELNYDPERKGVGVLIRVDKLSEPFGQVTQER